jgi:hypothetical protein
MYPAAVHHDHAVFKVGDLVCKPYMPLIYVLTAVELCYSVLRTPLLWKGEGCSMDRIPP